MEGFYYEPRVVSRATSSSNYSYVDDEGYSCGGYPNTPNRNGCKSLYVGILSEAAEPYSSVDGKVTVGSIGRGLQLAMVGQQSLNQVLKVKPDGTRYSFFNFDSPEHCEFGFNRLIILKDRLVGAENDDVFEPHTVIRYTDRTPYFQPNPDLRNVHVRNLRPSTKQDLLDAVGKREFHGFTGVSVTYHWNASQNPVQYATCHANFSFETVPEADEGEKKLRAMMTEQLLNVFTASSRIERERQRGV